jgi:Family of unknown function (DUF6266)
MSRIDILPFNLSGKIGDYVYYTLRGKPVVRKRPTPRKTEPSPAELKLRSQFSFISKFLVPLKSIFNASFKSNSMSGMNRAISVNFNHVIADSYPDWRIDFSKLLLGQGDVAGLRDLSVNVHIPGHLVFNWNGKSRGRGAASHDRVYVAVYCEHLNLWLTRLDSVRRKNDSFILDAEPFSGFPVQVYLGLISDFWGGSSDSQYLGKVKIL